MLSIINYTLDQRVNGQAYALVFLNNENSSKAAWLVQSVQGDLSKWSKIKQINELTPGSSFLHATMDIKGSDIYIVDITNRQFLILNDYGSGTTEKYALPIAPNDDNLENNEQTHLIQIDKNQPKIYFSGEHGQLLILNKKQNNWEPFFRFPNTNLINLVKANQDIMAVVVKFNQLYISPNGKDNFIKIRADNSDNIADIFFFSNDSKLLAITYTNGTIATFKYVVNTQDSSVTITKIASETFEQFNRGISYFGLGRPTSSDQIGGNLTIGLVYADPDNPHYEFNSVDISNQGQKISPNKLNKQFAHTVPPTIKEDQMKFTLYANGNTVFLDLLSQLFLSKDLGETWTQLDPVIVDTL